MDTRNRLMAAEREAHGLTGYNAVARGGRGSDSLRRRFR